jgi:hypothetical protein
MDELLRGPIPSESQATCSDCAMAPQGDGPPAPSGEHFLPDVKCCGYLPRLPNFLVGAALADEGLLPEGRRSLEARIDARVGVTPLGLEETPAFTLLYQSDLGMKFGRSRRLRCPHYVDADGGLCGVWRHRNSVCATYFCKHDRGATGQAFWVALRNLLREIERSLAESCALDLEPGDAALEALLAVESSRGPRVDGDELDGVAVDPEKHRALWGSYWGREREFYLECARRVAGLSWDDVLARCGARARARARLARVAYARRMDEALPSRLRVGSYHIGLQTGDVSRISTYSPYDPLEVPNALLGALPRFEGRTRAEAVERIRSDHALDLDDESLRKLVDFGVLVSAEEPAATRGAS